MPPRAATRSWTLASPIPPRVVRLFGAGIRLDLQRGFRHARVLRDIHQQLRGEPEQQRAPSGGERFDLALDIHGYVQAMPGLQAVGEDLQCPEQAGIVESRRIQVCQQAAGLALRLVEHRACLPEDTARIVTAGVRHQGRQHHPQPGDHLRQAVVQVLRDAATRQFLDRDQFARGLP